MIGQVLGKAFRSISIRSGMLAPPMRGFVELVGQRAKSPCAPAVGPELV
jgi:hypothetical protein